MSGQRALPGWSHRMLAEVSTRTTHGLVILMIHRDRPSIRLTADERRQFDELAARLRYELDEATFDPPRQRLFRRRPPSGPRVRRATHLAMTTVGTWWAGPAALALGLLFLGPTVLGWVTIAYPALIVPPAAVTGLGGALTATDLARRGCRRATRLLRRRSRSRDAAGADAQAHRKRPR